MSASTRKSAASKSIMALRAYLASASKAELNARVERVESLGLPGDGPTVAELVAQRSFSPPTPAQAFPSVARFAGSVFKRDVPAEYSYAMAA